MLYTLLKFLGWGSLLAIIGGCVGWALRALKSRSESSRVTASSVDSAEVERLRDRLADFEQVVAERDRLRIQLADVRHADSPGIVGGVVPPAPRPESSPPEITDDLTKGVPSNGGDADDATSADDVDAHDRDGRVDERNAGILDDGADQRRGEGEGQGELPTAENATDDADRSDDAASDDAGTASSAGPEVGVPPDVVSDEPGPGTPDERVPLDLVEAAAVLGRRVELDDLTVIEGIGPKISQLCSGIGITTWRELAGTDVDDLQSMLDAAGSRYTVHKPGTWPRQAALLAGGRWAEFKALSLGDDGGSSPDPAVGG